MEIRFNLADATVRSRDGASGVVSGNVTSAEPGWFVNAVAGDLHLTAAALAAIDRATPHPDVTRDYDQQARPVGTAPDVGADEFGALGAPPAAPTSLILR